MRNLAATSVSTELSGGGERREGREEGEERGGRGEKGVRTASNAVGEMARSNLAVGSLGAIAERVVDTAVPRSQFRGDLAGHVGIELVQLGDVEEDLAVVDLGPVRRDALDLRVQDNDKAVVGRWPGLRRLGPPQIPRQIVGDGDRPFVHGEGVHLGRAKRIAGRKAVLCRADSDDRHGVGFSGEHPRLGGMGDNGNKAR